MANGIDAADGRVDVAETNRNRDDAKTRKQKLQYRYKVKP